MELVILLLSLSVIYINATIRASSGCSRQPTIISREYRESLNHHGSMYPLKNAHLVQLHGSAYERGLAHGYLLSQQIIDWLVCYQYIYNMNGNLTYYDSYRSWLKINQNIPSDYALEARGVIDGMIKSEESIYVEEFGRDFDIFDLYVMNSYLEGSVDSGAMTDGPFTSSNPMKQAESPACTQFVAWGRMTTDGKTVAGRNMDGETDPSYVTVTHLIVFAVAPSEQDRLRYVSVMWPGHIGTLSAMNEDGVSIMLNCGTMGPGSIATNVTAIEWTIRDLITSTLQSNCKPSYISEKLNEYKCSEGGVSAAGSVLVLTRPVPENYDVEDEDSAPGFIAELDRYGGMIRTADNYIPAIFESNHFILYGVDADSESDPSNPEYNFGEAIGFSSRWRLQAIRSVLESINRTTEVNSLNKISSLTIGQSVSKIMRAPAHGATEHSIAFKPSSSKLYSNNRRDHQIAIANSQPWLTSEQWDAPYGTWIEYNFEDLFKKLPW